MTDIRTDLLQQGHDAAPFGLGGNGAVEDFWALLKPVDGVRRDFVHSSRSRCIRGTEHGL